MKTRCEFSGSKSPIGDSHAIWRSHQTTETQDDFELLFAKLADRPDDRVPLEDW